MKYISLGSAGVGHSGYQQRVKEANIKRIFDLVRGGKCKSRAELVRLMNLSATSVSVLVDELNERGLINETGPKQTSLPGRRPISLRLNRDAHQLPVFVLSREGVRFDLLNLNCEVLETRFFPLPADTLTGQSASGAYIDLFEDALAHHARLYDPHRALAVCVVFPGLYTEDSNRLMASCSLGLNLSVDEMARLQQRVPLPMFFASCTRSLAYAEKKLLDAARADADEIQDMLFVQIDDTVHGALICCGTLYPGPHNISGEIGHFTVDYRGRPCICGSEGCLERYISSAALLQDAGEVCRELGVAAPESLSELAARAESEAPLKDFLVGSARLLAGALYSAMCGSGVKRVILGGSITALGRPFLEDVYRALSGRLSLADRLELSYAQSLPEAASEGIAQYFLDKVYSITH